MVASVTVNYQSGIGSGMTLRWVAQVWEGYSDTIFRSIGIALACLACTLLLGVPAAYALARRQGALARTIEELLVMPVAIPGLATAMALIVTYNTPGEFRTSWTFILTDRKSTRLNSNPPDISALSLRDALPISGDAGRHPRPSDRDGPNRHLQHARRVPHLLDLHPDRPRAVQAAVHGAFGPGGDGRDRPEDAGGGRGEPRRRIFPAHLHRRAAELPFRHPGGLAHGRDPVHGRVQHDLAPPHAAHQDAARRSRRRLRFAPPRGRQRLHPGVLRHDRPAPHRHPGAGPAGRAGNESDAAMSEAPAPLAIRLERCGKTFADGTRALEPLDLEIRAGETLVVLGPSGCGKTTALRIIAGLEEPDPRGRGLLDGTDVTPVPIERRRVGLVFQSYALFPNMDVRGNIAYGLRIGGLDKAGRDARVDEMLAMMRIESLADRRIDQLSGGQRQRAAPARAPPPR